MSFTNSLFLWGFLPWLILLALPARKHPLPRAILTAGANLLFYLFGGIGFLLFLCAYILGTWVMVRLIDRFRNKPLFIAGCLMLSLPLLLIKYSAFTVQSVNGLFMTDFTVPVLAVPMGISFFTFTALSVFSDTYHGRLEKPLSLPEAFLYLSFFPTVTSGPILRLADFRREAPELPSMELLQYAMSRIVLGLSKKLLLADKLAPLADYYFNGIASGKSFSVTGLWIGAIAYAMQLYLDFSGYSDIAIGIGSLLGVTIPENFNKPYHARSIQDFWRRWHITLSSWFRDYIYIPLGGSRCSAARHIRNLLIVWLLTGLWHGAGWTFILWGLGYFLLLTAEKKFPLLKNQNNRPAGHLYVLLCVTLLWVFFRSASLSAALNYIGGLFGIGASGFLPESMAVEFLPFLFVIILGYAFSDPVLRRFGERPWFRVILGVGMIAAAVLCVSAILNATYTPYIYGNF